MKNMFFIGFMGIFAWCNGMLAPAYAQGIINYSQVSCSGSAEVMFVFQHTEGRQLLGGDELIFRTAFKPTATILQSQKTVNVQGENTELAARGRHDPCVVPRAVPIVEAMTALVLVDHWMRHSAQNRIFKF